MNITVINGTEKHGVSYRLKEIFLAEFKDKATIAEYYLPKDGTNFCVGLHKLITQNLLTRTSKQNSNFISAACYRNRCIKQIRNISMENIGRIWAGWEK